MARHGLERILLRNDFYRENYRYLSLVVVLLIVMIMSLIGLIWYQYVVLLPKPKYFATTPDGRPIPVVRLDEAYYENNYILDWSKQAVMDIYSLDYVTYRNSLQAAEVFFTTKGYKDFLTALKASTNLDAVKAKRQVVTANVTGTPEVTRQGQLSADVPYSWDIKMPVKVTYQNSENEVILQDAIVLIQIERTSLLRHKEGVAISQLVLQEKSK